MNLLWHRDQGVLSVGGDAFDVTSIVRNEVNGWRKLHDPKEVIRSVSRSRAQGPAVMPRPFPLGEWNITGIVFIDDPASDFFPLKILTDANQPLEIWDLDPTGGYAAPSGKKVIDWGYWLHWISWSTTTQGCGKVGDKSPAQILRLASIIYDAVKDKDCKLEVI